MIALRLAVFVVFALALQSALGDGRSKEEWEAYYQEVFNKYDTDRDGKINEDEFVAGLIADNSTMSEEEMRTLFRRLDENANEYLQFPEMANFMEQQILRYLFYLFDLYDVDQDKYLSKEDLVMVFASIGIDDVGEETDRILNADSDGDGKVDFKEFKKVAGLEF